MANGNMNSLKHYLALTKPTILFLVIITGATALIINSKEIGSSQFIYIMIALYLTGGCANALNQYFERDIDSQMERTKMKRPLASKVLSHNRALAFSILIGVLGLYILSTFNILAMLLGLFTILFYSFFYTLYLKPRTPQNIVIGGIAGSMGPLIAWAAIEGNLFDIAPWSIFFLIFLWTPPHFWALALYLKEDYKKVNYPMMPNVVGDHETVKKMIVYSLLMVMISYSVLMSETVKLSGIIGLPYIILATLLGAKFIHLAYKIYLDNTTKSQKSLFGYSILYVFMICFSIIIDVELF